MSTAPSSACRAVLTQARQLHRQAGSDSPASALPVLRRLIDQQIMRNIRLPALYQSRHVIQRKHLLQLLAREAGHSSWAEYRSHLQSVTPAQLVHFDLLRQSAGYPNVWFSSIVQANQHAQTQGGRVMAVGTQAVVITSG